MSNHLVIIKQSNDDSIIKVMTRKEIINRGRSGLTIVEGNLLKGFGQIMDIRKDLNMRKGKMVAQGAHASMKVLTDCITKDKKTVNQIDIYKFYPSKQMQRWLEGSFTKICVSVDTEVELLTIYTKARIANIPCSIIVDSGRTEFNNVPTYTAVAIGPAENEKIDKLTGHLKLL